MVGLGLYDKYSPYISATGLKMNSLICSQKKNTKNKTRVSIMTVVIPMQLKVQWQIATD